MVSSPSKGASVTLCKGGGVNTDQQVVGPSFRSTHLTDKRYETPLEGVTVSFLMGVYLR